MATSPEYDVKSAWLMLKHVLATRPKELRYGENHTYKVRDELPIFQQLIIVMTFLVNRIVYEYLLDENSQHLHAHINDFSVSFQNGDMKTR